MDTLRGIALLVIASNHIHGNRLTLLTPLAWGYWDMAELFVFLSGYVTGLSATRMMDKLGAVAWFARLLTRCVTLYFAYVVTGTVLVWLVHRLGSRLFLGAFDDALLLAPQWSVPLLIGSLRYQVSHLSILPLYMMLLVASGPLMLAGRRIPWLLVSGAFGLYAGVQLFPHALRLPEPYGEAFYYNPLAWQAVFHAGATLALWPGARTVLGRSRVVLFAAWVTLLVYWVLAVRDIDLGWRGKPNVEPLRLLNFAAVVLLGHRVLNSWRWWTGTQWLRPLIDCGRNSLAVYCGGALLSAGATGLRARWGGTLAIDLLLSVGACGGCLLIGNLCQRWRGMSR